MGAIELRNKIIELLNTDNVSYLEDIFEFAEKKKQPSSKSDTIAYTVQGKPLTQEAYVKQIKDADASINAGEFISVEDLEEEIRNWQ
ncbi:hypothetical protein IMCC3317_14830 [Kordia antarctica]|uniref:Uncharacterized protein n=1 Tax=Kordia antarctica TaxID=1218801 RepID=A0A7L4ZI89_9FLAO|nr:hypothetical protein [Kordia antarctica]QHI36129.1 hypothetical protein IMCC3317_14830 [Kordia antarctica]